MEYQHYDLGNIEKGKVIEVTLAYAANVRIMDNSNYLNFKNRRTYKYVGGYIKKAPYKVSIPKYSHWHVVVDLGGNSGKVKSKVNVL